MNKSEEGKLNNSSSKKTEEKTVPIEEQKTAPLSDSGFLPGDWIMSDEHGKVALAVFNLAYFVSLITCDFFN